MNLTDPFPCYICKYTIIMLAAIMLGLISSTPASTEESCTQLLTDRCESCHYLTRVCQKVDTERNKKRLFGNAAGTWKRTIKNMVKQGAKLDKNEEKILVECLSKPTAEALAICNLNK